jgi:uncharacterized protein YbjT (DUF2867 family)
MQRCLILGVDQPVGQLVATQLATHADVEVVGFAETPVSELPLTAQYNGDARKAATYLPALADVDTIYSDFTGLDVDWKLEAVFEALRQRRQSVRTVMRSVAGVDGEVTGELTYPGIDDPKTYLKQQRYGIKIVDEAELPYTVLRPVLDNVAGSDQVQLINEGEPVPVRPVTEAALAQVVVDELVSAAHVNQSLAVIGQ